MKLYWSKNDFQVITSNFIYLGKKIFQKQIFHWINYCPNVLFILYFSILTVVKTFQMR